IAGATGVADGVVDVAAAPDSNGQSWVDVKPLTCTSASEVIVSPGTLASTLIRPAGRSTATPPTRSRRFQSEPRPFAAFSAADVPSVLWTMTSSFLSGERSAFATRPG